MKKILFLLFFAGISTISYAQFPGSGPHERSRGLFHFHHGQKPHAQMHHFDKSRKDPYQKDNGTSYVRNKKRDYIVDGNGFDIAKASKREKRHRPRKKKLKE